MSAALTRGELDIIALLQKAGLPIPTATLAVVLVTREHARPEEEMADIIRQYQQLEEPSLAKQAIADLKRLGWLIESISYGQPLLHQVPELRITLAQKAGDEALADRLLEMRSTLEPNVRICGPMKEERVYTTYLDILRGAQREICLPMLATSPHLASVSILQERAQRGVHVRILLGAPEVVVALRGAPMAAMAREAIAGWRKNAQGLTSMEVRVAHAVEDMLIATCLIVDGQLLRFDVYDPTKQRSLQGVMIEVASPTGLQLNLVRLVQRCFDEAWNYAEPSRVWGKLWWWLRRAWQWLAFAFFAFLALALVSSAAVWSGIFASVAATFLVNALASSWSTIRARIWRPHD